MKTAQNTIRETSIYACFVYNSEQRPIHAPHVKDIMLSMQTFGFLPSKSIQCYQDGKKFVIIDGHHRFIAAKNLQIPVLYVVEPRSHQATIAPGNRLQRQWNAKNFVEMYAKRGNPAFLELLEYANLGIPIMNAALLLSGYSSNAAGCKAVYDGTLKVVTREKIEIIASFLREQGHTNGAYRNQNFINAFELCLRVADFDPSQLTRKLAANPKALTRTANVNQTLDQLEEIYNYHQTIKVPLAFLARQSKKRGAK